MNLGKARGTMKMKLAVLHTAAVWKKTDSEAGRMLGL